MKKLILTLLVTTCLAFGNEIPCWFTNIDDAIYEAKTSNKLVMLLFTGPDWCPPCKKLERDVFPSAEFRTYASKNLVLVRMEFPRGYHLSNEQNAYNHSMQTKYKIDGYPTVIMLNSMGKRIGTPDACWISKDEFMTNIKAYRK